MTDRAPKLAYLESFQTVVSSCLQCDCEADAAYVSVR